jgi:hypothetical protein
VGVCSRLNFVGRRRALKRCLRALQARQGAPDYAEGVLVHGMGGLGKSSLAARLCERLPRRRLVWVGRLDELEFLRVLGERLAGDEAAVAVLNKPGLALQGRLQQLLDGPLAAKPALFVFDDFEQNLERTAGGGAVLQPEALGLLKEFLDAGAKGGLESSWTYRAEPDGGGTKLTIDVEYDVPDHLVSRLPSRHILEAMKNAEAELVINNLKALLEQ